MRNIISTKQSGVSLIELILVVAAIGFLALMVANLPSTISSINKSQHSSLAKDIANKKIEYFRKQSFSSLLNETNGFIDSQLLELPEASASYEISDCPEAICISEGERSKLKQLKVNIFWQEQEDPKKLELITLIGEGGIGQ